MVCRKWARGFPCCAGSEVGLGPLGAGGGARCLPGWGGGGSLPGGLRRVRPFPGLPHQQTRCPPCSAAPPQHHPLRTDSWSCSPGPGSAAACGGTARGPFSHCPVRVDLLPVRWPPGSSAGACRSWGDLRAFSPPFGGRVCLTGRCEECVGPGKTPLDIFCTVVVTERWNLCAAGSGTPGGGHRGGDSERLQRAGPWGAWARAGAGGQPQGAPQALGGGGTQEVSGREAQSSQISPCGVRGASLGVRTCVGFEAGAEVRPGGTGPGPRR